MTKLNKKGYFIIETIVVIALVSTIIAYILPNISKLYEEYKYRTQMFDQTEDIYLLKAIYNKHMPKFNEANKNDAIYIYRSNTTNSAALASHSSSYDVDNIEVEAFVIEYNGHPKIFNRDNSGGRENFVYDTNFNRYISRLKMKTYDNTSNRLVARFNRSGNISYASIKIVANSLPAGYTKLASLQSTDGQFIETPIIYASSSMTVEKLGQDTQYQRLSLADNQQIYIFGGTGADIADSNNSNNTFYGAKITENGNIIHNFVPAKKEGSSAGTAECGVYDVIESKFYTSSNDDKEFPCN